MRILIATGIFPPDIGGPATYSQTIAEELSRRGHEVVIVTYYNEVSRISHLVSGENSEIQNTKYKIRFVSRKLPKGLRHLLYFWQVLKNGARADSIYAQDAVSAGFPAVLAALILRKKFFLKVVGDHAWEQGTQQFGVKDLLDDFLAKRYGFRVGVLRAAQKFVASRALRIVVPSEYLQSVVERWGVSRKKITVIPNAVPVLNASILKEKARAKLGLDGFVLLSVGRLVPWKGFSMLIELTARLIQKISEVKLVIVGSGPEEKYLASRVSYLGLENMVHMAGSMPKDNLIAYLIAADVFLLNTGYEGFSHQLIEAMAVGIPIVTTNAGGNKEIVRDGENALVAQYNNLVDWEEKIIRLYGDMELRSHLQKPNYGIIQTYSIEHMIQKTESLFLAI